MTRRRKSSEELLQDILRGAARLTGCNSTNLIVVDPRRDIIRVRVGVTEVDYAVLREIEHLLGIPLRGIEASLESARQGLLVAVWRDGQVRESSSLAEMVGEAFPEDLTRRFESLIGVHRFLLVPVGGPRRRYGVLVFEKGGLNPFSLQQRQVLLRYARRIGDILDGGLREPACLNDLLRPDIDQLEGLLLQLAASQDAPVVYLDPDLRVTSGNEALARLMDLPADELAGLELQRLLLEPEPLVRLLKEKVLYSSLEGLEEMEVVLRRADGSFLSANAEVLLLADDQSRVVGFLVLLRPREAGQSWSPERLLEQQRMATMAEMAAQLAHEIRNPLVAVGAAIEGLQATCTDEAQRETVGEILAEIGRLDQILKKYLAPRGALLFRQLHLRELIDGVAKLLGERLPPARLHNLVPEGLQVRADQDALRHLLFNLLLNAIEAGDGNIEVTCRAEELPSGVRVLVEDNGPGLKASPEMCFQPFFTTKEQGSGLGLSVCARLAQAHGGVVRLANRPEGGCRAELLLPHSILETTPGTAEQ